MLTNPCYTFRGQSRSSNIVTFHMLGIVSFCAIVSVSLRRFPICNFKKCRNLEIRIRVHARSLKVAPFNRLRMISYKCSIETLSLLLSTSIMPRYFIYGIYGFGLLTGPSMSLEMSPCDTAHTTSYSRSTVTMALSRVVSEIFNVEKCRDLEIGFRGHSRSLRVVSLDRLCMISY